VTELGMICTIAA